MPIYEYKCTSCNHRFEHLQKFSDPLLTDCPICGKSALEKCVSVPSFQLKGSGWYETDYKKKKTEEGKKDTKKETADVKKASKESKEEK